MIIAVMKLITLVIILCVCVCVCVHLYAPSKSFAMYTNYYDTAKLHVHSYKSTNDRQYCLWTSCVVSLHQQEELPLQHEGHNIHDNFTVSHPPEQQYYRSCTMGWYFVQNSGSEMTCIVGINGDYSERRSEVDDLNLKTLTRGAL